MDVIGVSAGIIVLGALAVAWQSRKPRAQQDSGNRRTLGCHVHGCQCAIDPLHHTFPDPAIREQKVQEEIAKWWWPI